MAASIKNHNSSNLYTQLFLQFKERITSNNWSNGMRLPTELELAKEHGVSRGTVRMALSELESEGLLERVQGRGTFVRYQAANNPTRVVTKQDKRIGLLFNRPLSAQIDIELMVGIEQAVKERGYQLNLACAEENQEQQIKSIERFQADQVAGLIIYPLADTTYDASIAQLKEKGLPVVLAGIYLPQLDTDYVVADNLDGAYRAIQHLLILGHKRIGFVYNSIESLSTSSVRERWEGYCQALNEYGIAYDENLVVQQPAQNPYKDTYLKDYLQQSDPPTAVFAVNDILALELMQSANNQGLRVPQDLALVGFDNLSFASRLTPPLTTVAQPFIDIGLRSGNLLVNRIEGMTGPTKHIRLATNLIVRTSCGSRLQILNSVR